jgi:Uncharacterized protein conserved in bacteria
MRDKVANPDLEVAGIAARQHGVVALRQLHAAGMGRNGVARRVRAGLLHRVHRGVYAVGHPGLTQEGRWMAAALACGDAAFVSHRSAAALWGLLRPGTEIVDISVLGDGGRARRVGIRLRRCVSLAPELTTRRQGIPVTTPARTIADLRCVVSSKELRRAIRQADMLGLTLGPEAIPDRTRSEFEYLFLRFCRRHLLPVPEVNVRIDEMEVDFLWRESRLAVETDGYRYHRGRAAFEDDRERDLRLRTLGYEVVRLTYRQVVDDPQQTATALKELLAVGG